MKKIAIIPTLLTLGNAVCGFAAIAYASKITSTEEHYFAVSGWFIIGAMLFDAFDGYVARLSKSASKFGGELDSLCDGISFGLAPAFLVMRMGPGWDNRLMHQFLAGIATLYLVCTLLRLARFNVENTPDPASHRAFRGLPSPGAAGCLASLAILRGGTTRWFTTVDSPFIGGLFEFWATLGALALALLMVSRIPYPHATKQFLKQSLHGRRHLSHLVQLLLLLFVIVMISELALLIGFWLYALGFPLRYMLLRAMRPQAVASARGDELLPH